MVRKTVYAGTFYPKGNNELKTMLETFFASASLEVKNVPKILIVPHAGYIYSGQVAAFGFKQLLNSKIEKVILLGVSHHALFSGAAVFNQGFWNSPLGDISINSDLASRLINEKESIYASFDEHSFEHSLEVEIPFLQICLKKFSIVPILIGELSESTQKILATKIASQIDEKTILVISSDLSHYPSFEEAKKIDNQTIKAILNGNIKVFQTTIEELMNKNIPNLVTCACGEKAIEIGLLIAQKKNYLPKLLKYQNSGDILGDKNQVVGYAAIGFY